MLKIYDIVQIPFPFSDLTHQKRRPVLLLTTPDAFGDFLAAAVTSQSGHDDAILLQDDDLVEGRLPKTSWIRGTRLFSLNRDTVIVTLGSLKPEAFERIHREICVQLGCKSC
ncbi:MAG: type II toxin-antitoxin system PemK/MazF family toxin [Methylobacter sp.]|jgi:mRNA interferase MazF|nr:type II toxin-antitoxin system PemK/MazF family toxin [Methylobacter sp.]